MKGPRWYNKEVKRCFNEEELLWSPEKHLSIEPIGKVFLRHPKSHSGRTVTSSHWFEEKELSEGNSIESFLLCRRVERRPKQMQAVVNKKVIDRILCSCMQWPPVRFEFAFKRIQELRVYNLFEDSQWS